MGVELVVCEGLAEEDWLWEAVELSEGDTERVIVPDGELESEREGVSLAVTV